MGKYSASFYRYTHVQILWKWNGYEKTRGLKLANGLGFLINHVNPSTSRKHLLKVFNSVCQKKKKNVNLEIRKFLCINIHIYT